MPVDEPARKRPRVGDGERGPQLLDKDESSVSGSRYLFQTCAQDNPVSDRDNIATIRGQLEHQRICEGYMRTAAAVSVPSERLVEQHRLHIQSRVAVKHCDKSNPAWLPGRPRYMACAKEDIPGGAVLGIYGGFVTEDAGNTDSTFTLIDGVLFLDAAGEIGCVCISHCHCVVWSKKSTTPVHKGPFRPIYAF